MCFEKTDLIVFGILEREGTTFEVEFFSRDDAVRCAGCAEKITKILFQIAIGIVLSCYEDHSPGGVQ